MKVSLFSPSRPFRPALCAVMGAVSAALWSTLPLAAQTPVDEHPTIQTTGSQGVAVEAPTPKPPATPPAPGTLSAFAQEKRTADSSTTPFNHNAMRHQQFLNREKLGGIDLLFIGDSILDRMPKVGEATWLRFAPFHPADLGVDGERTEDVLWRLQNGELEGIHPKVAVVLIGTNNFGIHKAEQAEWAAAGVRKIVDTLHGKLPDTKVLLLGIFPRGNPDDPLRVKIEAVNAILAKLDDGKTTRFLDFGKKFLDDQKNIPHDVMLDKLHPTAKGYEIWWEAMHPLLDEMMAAAAPPTPSPTPTPTATPVPTPAPAASATPSPAKGAKPK